MNRRRFFGVAATAPAAAIAKPATAIVEMVEADIAPIVRAPAWLAYEQPLSFRAGDFVMAELERLYLDPGISPQDM